jgi:hypothetical protein
VLQACLGAVLLAANGASRADEAVATEVAVAYPVLGSAEPATHALPDDSSTTSRDTAEGHGSSNSLAGRASHWPTPLGAGAPKITAERPLVLPAANEWIGGSMLVDAEGRPLTQMGGVTYRWWLQRGRANFGVGVGTLGFVTPVSDGPHALLYPASTLTVGWRYTVDERSTFYADASSARRYSGDGRADLYNTKVGIEWKSRPARFGFDGASRSFGLQFDSGFRMSLRLKRGGVGMYLRSQF